MSFRETWRNLTTDRDRLDTVKGYCTKTIVYYDVKEQKDGTGIRDIHIFKARLELDVGLKKKKIKTIDVPVEDLKGGSFFSASRALYNRFCKAIPNISIHKELDIVDTDVVKKGGKNLYRAMIKVKIPVSALYKDKKLTNAKFLPKADKPITKLESQMIHQRTRSRSRDKTGKNRSRSREKTSKSRSESRDKGHKHRSDSREKPHKSRSDSREKPHKNRSDSRDKTKHRTRSRSR